MRICLSFSLSLSLICKQTMPAVDDCSFFDFSHDITCTEKRYVVALAEFEQLSQSYNSLCEKLRTGQSEQPIKKEHN